MTSWRNNNQKDTFTNPKPNPFFDILTNTNENIESVETVEGFKEGVQPFDWEGNGYFINVPRFQGLSGAAEVGRFLKKIIQYILSPIINFDKNLQATILKILEVCVLGELMDCNTHKGIKNVSARDNSFTWLKKTFTTNKEGFKKKGVSYTKAELNQEAIDYSDTINSFITLHPGYKDKIKQLTTDYINKLNKFYADRGNYVSDMELLEFNNNYEATLSDPKRKATFSTPDTPDTTAAPYQPRFTFFKDDKPNTSKIEFFPFNDAYFPLPKDMKSFELALEFDLSNNNFDKTKEILNDFKLPEYNPIKQTKGKPNPNFVFSVNLSKPRKDTMQNYMRYVVERFSIVLHNIRNGYRTETISSYTFDVLLKKMATVYEAYITILEEIKYNNTKKFLTIYEIAMLNHLFFCCIHQYSNSGYNNINLKKYILNQTSPSTIISNVIYHLNNNTSFIDIKFTNWQTNWQTSAIKLYEDSSLRFYTIFMKDDINIKNNYLINANNDIEKYYKADIFAAEACADQNQAILDQFNSYAHTIKQEIYRILCIPIVIFIVYNFYYMVFFKDCFDYGKDENGDFADKPKDGNCFYPMFPDWEQTFHSIEKNKTDFFFEFIFKPVKLFYSLMNAGKAVLRKSCKNPFFEYDTLNDNIPYIIFVACFYWIYSTILNKGGVILNTIYGLFDFNIPNIPIFESFGTNKFVSSIIYVCFGISFLKEVFGVNLSAMASGNYMKDVLKKGLEAAAKSTGGVGIDDIMGQAENILGKTWALWILKGMTPINFIVRTLITIIYWIMKLIVSRLMIPISMFITTIYILFIPIFGIFSYTDKGHSIFEKMDLIDRFIYTKLYKVDDKQTGFYGNLKSYSKFFFKLLSWSVIYFLSEIVILYTLITTTKTFDKMKLPSTSKISTDIQKKMEKALNGVKHFVYVACMIFISFLSLWIAYKFKFKNDVMRKSYNNDENGNSNEKVFKMDNCDGKIPVTNLESNQALSQFYDKHADDIGDYNENIDHIIKTLIFADKYNSVAHDYYNAKTGHIERRPILTKFLNNFTFLNPKGIQDTQEDREKVPMSKIKNFANTALGGLSNKGIDLTKGLSSIVPDQDFLKGVNSFIPDANKFRPLEGFKNQDTGQNIKVNDLITSASKFLGTK